MIPMTVNDIPNQSKSVALLGSLYLMAAQAIRPPSQLKRKANPKGSSHQAHEVRSTAIVSFCSLEIGAPHSGQNAALLDILAPQAPHRCRDLPQYWQKVASGVILPHLGHLIFVAISIHKIQLDKGNVNGSLSGRVRRDAGKRQDQLEATSGLKPLNRGSAGPRLATWLPRHLEQQMGIAPVATSHPAAAFKK
jgi:hypothetical protein